MISSKKYKMPLNAGSELKYFVKKGLILSDLAK